METFTVHEAKSNKSTHIDSFYFLKKKNKKNPVLGIMDYVRIKKNTENQHIFFFLIYRVGVMAVA